MLTYAISMEPKEPLIGINDKLMYGRADKMPSFLESVICEREVIESGI